MLVWLCNIMMVISILTLVIFAWQIVDEDLFVRYAEGKVTSRNEGPAGSVPGFSFTVEYFNPDTKETISSFWNPIRLPNGKVGDTVNISYRKNLPNDFGPTNRAAVLKNARNGMVVFIGILLVSLAIRLALVGALFSID